MLGIEQKSLYKRVMLCLPLIVIISALIWWSNLSAASFGKLWNYFAWGNQVLAASTLLAASAWLVSLGKNYIITLVPGVFMTFIVTTFILWTSPEHGGPAGLGLNLYVAYGVGAVITFILAAFALKKGKNNKSLINLDK